MAKKQTKPKPFYDKPWKHGVAAVVAFLLAYGGASWAIDSGRLLVYFATLVLLILGIHHVIAMFKKAHAR